MKLVRYADRPDLRAIRFETLSQRTSPLTMLARLSPTLARARAAPLAA